MNILNRYSWLVSGSYLSLVFLFGLGPFFTWSMCSRTSILFTQGVNRPVINLISRKQVLLHDVTRAVGLLKTNVQPFWKASILCTMCGLLRWLLSLNKLFLSASHVVAHEIRPEKVQPLSPLFITLLDTFRTDLVCHLLHWFLSLNSVCSSWLNLALNTRRFNHFFGSSFPYEGSCVA